MSKNSNLYRHAESELRREGLLGDTEDFLYGDMLGQAVLDLIELFADQGHSGMSAGYTLHIFERLANFQSLSPLSSDPEEWNEVGDGVWQNNRFFACFSEDGGKTYYNIDEDKVAWYKRAFNKTASNKLKLHESKPKKEYENE